MIAAREPPILTVECNTGACQKGLGRSPVHPDLLIHIANLRPYPDCVALPFMNNYKIRGFPRSGGNIFRSLPASTV